MFLAKKTLCDILKQQKRWEIFKFFGTKYDKKDGESLTFFWTKYDRMSKKDRKSLTFFEQSVTEFPKKMGNL